MFLNVTHVSILTSTLSSNLLKLPSQNIERFATILELLNI